MSYENIFEWMRTILVWWGIIGFALWLSAKTFCEWLEAIMGLEGDEDAFKIFSPTINWRAVFFLGPVFWLAALGVFLKEIGEILFFVWERMNSPFTK